MADYQEYRRRVLRKRWRRRFMATALLLLLLLRLVLTPLHLFTKLPVVHGVNALLGGVLGIVLGYIVSMAANRILPMISSDIDVTVSPSFNSIVVAFGISVGIGVLFGYLPAKRAARLNPIEALRYD